MKIRVDAASKTYMLGRSQVHALTDATLSVEPGEFIAVTGPSGSGKSTLLHLLGALDKPTQGEVLFGDMPLSRLDDSRLAALRRHRIGFIFQSFNLIPVLSVFGNVELPLKLQGIAAKQRIERVEETLRSVGMIDRAQHKSEELSGGQRQRVAIARALVTRPDILLSDEPTANLDSKTGSEIIDLMQRLNADHRVTLVFATHDPSIVACAGRIVRIRDGRIVEDRLKQQAAVE